jgi:hypothetical protein
MDAGVHTYRIAIMCWFEVLQTGVKDPCLHGPENWLVRQLVDEPKLVYEVGFIREKGKATAREMQWSLETSSSRPVKAGAFMDVLTLGLGKG